jgi:CRP-like cAMP-binding protein
MPKEALIHYIRTVLPMSLEKAKQISTYFHSKQFLKNEYILSEGTICSESHFIEEGFLRAYLLDADGNEITTHFYSKNGFATDFLSFFKCKPAAGNVQALCDCKAWGINYEDLQICFHTIPEFREFGRMMLINSYSQLQDRMLGLLKLTAEQRYEKLLHLHPEIFQNASLKNISTYIGVTDTSLSRIRKELVKK